MKNTSSRARLFGALFCLPGIFALAMLPAAVSAETGRGALNNAGCMECHDGKKELASETPGKDAAAVPRMLKPVARAKYGAGAHAGMRCVACHTGIVDNQSPHRKTDSPKLECARCHEQLLAQAEKDGRAAQRTRLGAVVKNIEAYRRSFHGQPLAEDKTRPNATCEECHDSHAFSVPTDKSSAQYAQWRLGNPALCSQNCHEEQLETYQASIHGEEIFKKANAKSAVCTDCHTTHEITSTSLKAFKLLQAEECGHCHEANLKSYRDTYHGQVTKLGYPYTAKCYNCHGSHEIRNAKDAKSKMHPSRRLETCQKCHDGKDMPKASAGFATFEPHAHARDFERYPQVWLTMRIAVVVVFGVFCFFWLHCLLWYYREWKDRKEGKSYPHLKTEGMQVERRFRGPQHIVRFGPGWRIAHLVFALVTMILILTGITALFAQATWAPQVAQLFGGPRNMAYIHRVAAILFGSIFLLHVVYLGVRLFILQRGRFDWFGPDSLLPQRKDLREAAAMFRWFLGKGPRPLLDRWSYFEKFDYWAVFWGVFISVFSGLMLAYPHVAATWLPGWTLNVAHLVHGIEAFMAAVFIFTVHFFNNHFRPDKLPPPDVVMFTGTLSMDEFRRDHPAEFKRYKESGELEQHLVDAPSAPLRLASKILGLALIACGLLLLILVGTGLSAIL